jgi:hypothetical protein
LSAVTIIIIKLVWNEYYSWWRSRL